MSTIIKNNLLIFFFPFCWLFSSVDSNGSLWPAGLHLRIELPWVEELFPAKTKGALAAVSTLTLKSVRAKETVMCISSFILRNDVPC